MAKVFATDNKDDVLAFCENGSQSLTKEDVDRLYAVLDSLSKTLADVKEKIAPPPPTTASEKKGRKETLAERLWDNRLRYMFIGKLVTAEEIDTVVNTLTLVCALILTIPYGVMTAANADYWDNIETRLAACPVHEFTYEEDFNEFKGGFNTVIYSNISVLIMAVLYYLLRPKEDEEFRRWWKSARYTLIMMMLGTVCSIVCLVIVSSWLFSWYIIPNSKLCTYSAKTDAIAGVVVIGFCALTGLFNML